MRRAVALLFLVAFLPANAEAEVRLEVGTVDGDPGDVVSLTVRLRADSGDEITGIAHEVSFGGQMVRPYLLPGGEPDCEFQSQLPLILSGFSGWPSRCESSGVCLGVTAAVLFREIFHPPAVASALYHCRFQIAPVAPRGVYPLVHVGAFYTTAGGAEFPATAVGGAVVVVGDPVATQTPRTPLPTPRVLGPDCTGDCDGSDNVDAAEEDAVLQAIFDPRSLVECVGSEGASEPRAKAAHLLGASRARHAGCTGGAPTATRSPTQDVTATPVQPATATASAPPTRTATVSGTPTQTHTLSRTSTSTRSPTPTASATLTRTPTGTVTPSPSSTRSPTPTTPATLTRAPTGTVTPSPSSTRSPTPTTPATLTPTPTPAATRTRTQTETSTPTHTGTPTFPISTLGPVTTVFAIANADGTLSQPSGVSPDGIPIYERPVGSGFVIVVEGRPGGDGLSVGSSAYDYDSSNPGRRPDLQLLADRPLGNGSTTVCGGSLRTVDGVPAVPSLDFGVGQPVSDAVNDIGCHFVDGTGKRRGRLPNAACILYPDGVYRFADSQSQIQFCATVSRHVEFPAGDTRLRVRLRSVGGSIGGIREIIVRRGAIRERR